jgi:hypothetical protein
MAIAKMNEKVNMECDICGHQWDGDVGPMDQCPACGLLFVGPIGQKDDGPSPKLCRICKVHIIRPTIMVNGALCYKCPTGHWWYEQPQEEASDG